MNTSLKILFVLIPALLHTGTVSQTAQNWSAKLLVAVKRNNLDETRRAILSGANVNVRDADDMTALQLALLVYQEQDVASLLLVAGAKPTPCVAETGGWAMFRSDTCIEMVMRTHHIPGGPPPAKAIADKVRLLVLAGQRPTAEDMRMIAEDAKVYPEIRDLYNDLKAGLAKTHG